LRLSYGTEAGYFAQEGLECVVMGPGEMARDGHQPDEGLDVAQFDACGAMMARILARLGAA
jgi:acetylornithine deacetylase